MIFGEDGYWELKCVFFCFFFVGVGVLFSVDTGCAGKPLAGDGGGCYPANQTCSFLVFLVTYRPPPFTNYTYPPTPHLRPIPRQLSAGLFSFLLSGPLVVFLLWFLWSCAVFDATTPVSIRSSLSIYLSIHTMVFFYSLSPWFVLLFLGPPVPRSPFLVSRFPLSPAQSFPHPVLCSKASPVSHAAFSIPRSSPNRACQPFFLFLVYDNFPCSFFFFFWFVWRGTLATSVGFFNGDRFACSR